MEHPCHKCGAAVEDGTPFCKQCGAPQIRVPGIEAQEPPAVRPPAPTPTESSPELSSLPGLLSPERRSGDVQWAHALPGAALGGAFSLLAAIVPYAIFGPAFLAGGAVAVILYRRHLKNELPSQGAHYAGRGYDPQKIQQVTDLLKSPQGLNFFVAFVLFILFLMFVVGSSIGGALYAAWARKRAQM